MPETFSPEAGKGARVMVGAGIVVPAAIGTTVLLGWTAHFGAAQSPWFGAAAMKVNPALCFVLAALSLWALSAAPPTARRRLLGDILAVAVGTIGLGTALEYLLHRNLGIDQLLVRDLWLSPQSGPPGRMAVPTALGLTLMALALLLLDRQAALSQFLALLGAFDALLVTAGYLYEAPTLTALNFAGARVSMALDTAITLGVLGVGILAARPDQGLFATVASARTGGVTARRLLPFALLLPLVVGWLRLQGERAGYYDARVGLAIFATCTAVLFTSVVWLNARWLNRVDANRHSMEQGLESVTNAAHCILWHARMEAQGEPFAHWDIRFVNEEAARRIMPVEVPPGQSFVSAAYRARLYEDEAAHHASVQAHLDRDENFRVEFQCRLADGSVRWYEEHVQVERIDATHWRAVGVVMDITHRKLLEEGIVAAQRRLERVVSSSPAVLFALRRDPEELRLTWLSANVRDLLGVRSSELLQCSGWGKRVHADDTPALASLEAALASGGRASADYRLRHQDGTYHWVRCALRELEGNGEEAEIFGSWSDVSEHRLLEEQLRQATKMEAVGRLAGGVAHDFNNMLAVINGYCELLLAHLPVGAPERESVQEIHRAGERAADLTRQLLVFSRKQVVMPRSLDLVTLVREFERMLGRLIGEDIQVKIITPKMPCRVLADAGQLEQILLNLAVNARDAMPQGGLLTLEVAAVELSAEYVRHHLSVMPGRYVVLSVSDTGIGMDAVTRSRIFEPFFTTKDLGKGTGLGLATVYGVVKQSGGEIWVYSELGRGTTFKVYLPEITEEPSQTREPSTAAPIGGTETVLLVEDEPMVRGLVRITLEERGYRVLVAKDGKQALALAQQEPGEIHMMVTDVVMPGMSGRELAERLQPLRPNAKVLFMSGYTDDAVVRHGVLVAGVNFLQKPFAPSALAAKVREVLDASLPAGELRQPTGESAAKTRDGR